MENMTNAAKMEAAAHIKEIKEKAEQEADKEAKEIILRSIYRCAADHTVETRRLRGNRPVRPDLRYVIAKRS